MKIRLQIWVACFDKHEADINEYIKEHGFILDGSALYKDFDTSVQMKVNDNVYVADDLKPIESIYYDFEHMVTVYIIEHWV